jgi:hypothetical protein
MDTRSLPSDMWIAMENGVQYYTLNPLKRDPDNMPPEPPSPFEKNISHSKKKVEGRIPRPITNMMG